MAINLDRNLLAELGLATLPDNEKTALLNHIYETLEMRVGMRLADQMTNEQLDEFEKYFEAKDDTGAFHWLETNFPNYKDVVQDEFNKLKEEVRLSAPEILQASQQQMAAQTTQPVAAANTTGVQAPSQPPLQPSYPQTPNSLLPQPSTSPTPTYEPPRPPLTTPPPSQPEPPTEPPSAA